MFRVSSPESRRSSSRTSTNRCCMRRRCSGSKGSARLMRISCTWAGRDSMSIATLGVASFATWKSSITIVAGSSSSSSSFANATAISSKRGRSSSRRSPTSRQVADEFRRKPSVTPRQKVVWSVSPSSHDIHIVRRAVGVSLESARVASHEATAIVLPEPGGPMTVVTGSCVPRSSASSSRGRVTKWCGTGGTRNFAFANCARTAADWFGSTPRQSTRSRSSGRNSPSRG
jgi:hypothetical protein